MRSQIFRALTIRALAFRTLGRTVVLFAIAIFLATQAWSDEPATKESESTKAPNNAKRRDNECIFVRTVNDWEVLDDSNVVVWGIRHHDAYRIELSMPLPGLKFEYRLAFIDGTHDGRLCSLEHDAIAVGQQRGAERSRILGITKLSAADLAKLENQYHVSLTQDDKKKAIPKEPARESAQ